MTAENKREVEIIYGIHRIAVEAKGFSVGEIRKTLEGPLNIDPRAQAVVNGRPADEGGLLEADDRLEFVRPSGSKGKAKGKRK